MLHLLVSEQFFRALGFGMWWDLLGPCGIVGDEERMGGSVGRSNDERRRNMESSGAGLV